MAGSGPDLSLGAVLKLVSVGVIVPPVCVRLVVGRDARCYHSEAGNAAVRGAEETRHGAVETRYGVVETTHGAAEALSEADES